MSINRVILFGYAGNDATKVEMFTTSDTLVTLSMATHDYYYDNDSVPQKITQWHSLEFWKSVGDKALAKIKKGDQIYLEGTLRYRSWQTNEDIRKYKTVIVVESFFVNTNKVKVLEDLHINAESDYLNMSHIDIPCQNDDLPY